MVDFWDRCGCRAELCDECNAVAQLSAALADLARERARLDWLGQVPSSTHFEIFHSATSDEHLRDLIDAAMSADAHCDHDGVPADKCNRCNAKGKV